VIPGWSRPASTGNIDAHVEAERGRKDDDSTAGVLVSVG
jgi:hypothetical protein